MPRGRPKGVKNGQGKGPTPTHCVDCGKRVSKGSRRCHQCIGVSQRAAHHVLTCVGCGITYRNVQRRSNRKYCSRECAFGDSERRFADRPVFSWVTPCPVCGVLSRGHGKRPCLKCQQLITQERAEQRIQVRARRREELEAKVYRYICGFCSVEFEARQSRRKYCCIPCAKRAARAKARQAKYGMRGREWAALRWRVLVRDEFVCYLCGVITNPEVDCENDQYPNAEHVIPLAEGGKTNMENLRCAHRLCNQKKARKEAARAMNKYLRGRNTPGREGLLEVANP